VYKGIEYNDAKYKKHKGIRGCNSVICRVYKNIKAIAVQNIADIRV